MLQRLTTEVAGVPDDMRVLITIVLRHAETLAGVLEQIRTMVAQNGRIVDRLGAVALRVSALEESR